EVPYLAASPHSAGLTALDLRGQSIEYPGLLALLDSPYLTGLKRLLVTDLVEESVHLFQAARMTPPFPHHLGAALDTARARGFELRVLGTETYLSGSAIRR